ncbi:MAG: STAS domain-containing protein [Actinomycetota bacterium]
MSLISEEPEIAREAARASGGSAGRRSRAALSAEAVAVAPAVVLTGELDIATVEVFREAVRPSVARGGPVLVDMTNLDFMDSTGVHAVIEIARALDVRGCLVLHGVRDPVKRLIEIVGISAIENIHVLPCDVDPFLVHA